MLLHADLLNCGDYFWELILWLLGAFILGYLLCWFLGAKYRDRIPILEKDLASWKSKANDLEGELSNAKYEKEKTNEALTACKRARADVEMKLRACMEQIADNSSGSSPDMLAATPASNPVAKAQNIVAGGSKHDDADYANFLKPDNLQIIEGIGPKIEELLKNNGIGTWASLAIANVERITSILSQTGPGAKIHDPSTWPTQAKLADEAKWQELIKYQRFLGGGKENENINSGSSKVEKAYMAARGLKAFANDDLKVVEGIGPKIEELLKAAKINSHIELAQTNDRKIKEILNAAGDKYRLADPSSWPKQARMAAEGKWDELKEYQDFLQGGKE